MNFTELAQTITKLGAPLLGTVLGGPAGGAIGSLIANQFGGSVDNQESIAALALKITGDPNAQVKLAEIEATNKVELQKLLIQSESNRMQNEISKISLDNTNTANARESNIKRETYYPEILSSVITLGFIICIYWIIAFKQDEADHDVLYLLMGVIGTAFNQVVNYWLGSSSQKVMRINKA